MARSTPCWRGAEGSPRQYVWLSTPPSEVLAAPRANAVVEAVDAIMAAASVGHVSEEILDQPVPGHVTDMDGAPATVRDVLFCEIC
jgi:hypothetical protein